MATTESMIEDCMDCLREVQRRYSDIVGHEGAETAWAVEKRLQVFLSSEMLALNGIEYLEDCEERLANVETTFSDSKAGDLVREARQYLIGTVSMMREIAQLPDRGETV